MRRLSDIKKIADFIVSNFKRNEYELRVIDENQIDVVVPYLPSNIVSLVSSNIRIGVFPLNGFSITVNIYKL